MKKLALLFTIALAFIAASETYSQTPIVFAKGASSKTMTVTIPANGTKTYSVSVRADQVINIGVSGDIGLSKTNDIPVISLNLSNGEDGVDNWQDGEGYLSILTGSKKAYVFSVANSSGRARTFTMKVSVTNDREDYQGGTDQ